VTGWLRAKRVTAKAHRLRRRHELNRRGGLRLESEELRQRGRNGPRLVLKEESPLHGYRRSLLERVRELLLAHAINIRHSACLTGDGRRNLFRVQARIVR
jgi:hypothetical protein